MIRFMSTSKKLQKPARNIVHSCHSAIKTKVMKNEAHKIVMTPPFLFDVNVVGTIRFLKDRTGLSTRQLAAELSVNPKLINRALTDTLKTDYVNPAFMRKAKATYYKYLKEHPSDSRPTRRDGAPIYCDPADAIERLENRPDYTLFYEAGKYTITKNGRTWTTDRLPKNL